MGKERNAPVPTLVECSSAPGLAGDSKSIGVWLDGLSGLNRQVLGPSWGASPTWGTLWGIRYSPICTRGRSNEIRYTRHQVSSVRQYICHRRSQTADALHRITCPPDTIHARRRAMAVGKRMTTIRRGLIHGVTLGRRGGGSQRSLLTNCGQKRTSGGDAINISVVIPTNRCPFYRR